MKPLSIIVIVTAFMMGLAGQSLAGSLQSSDVHNAICAAEAPSAAPSACETGVIEAAWQNRLQRILRGQGTVVWDRCPPGSDKFCPAGAYCCQNANGEYRCCK